MAKRAPRRVGDGEAVPTGSRQENTQEDGELFNILANPDDASDVILVVEGRELHANRVVLAHHSSVFRAMFFSSFKEKSEKKVPLIDKKYSDMVTFFNVLLAPGSNAMKLVSDDNLMLILRLADEYDTDHAKFLCQNYIGEQVSQVFINVYYKCTRDRHVQLSKVLPSSQFIMQGQTIKRKALVEKLTLYLWACEQYQLQTHRENVCGLLVNLVENPDDLFKSACYKSEPPEFKTSLLEALCRKLHSKDCYPSSSEESDLAFDDRLNRLLNVYNYTTALQ